MPEDFLELGIALGDSQLSDAMNLRNPKSGNLGASLVPAHRIKAINFGLFEVFAQQPGGVEFFAGKPIPGHDRRNSRIRLAPALNGNCNARQHEVCAVAGDLRHTRLVQVAEVHKEIASELLEYSLQIEVLGISSQALFQL